MHNLHFMNKFRTFVLTKYSKKNIEMTGVNFLRLITDPKCKNAFGKVKGLEAMKRRLSEENIFPVYHQPVQAENAAKMIVYSIICPYVGSPNANSLIRQYEVQFKSGIEKTSIGYLSRLLSGSEEIPHQVRIESNYGSISVDKINGDRIITDAEFWPGRFDKVPQNNGWPENEVKIPGAWLEMLRDKIKAGLPA